MKNKRNDVVRPLGLSIAIVGAANFYGILPLILYYLAYRLRPVADEWDILVQGGLPFDGWAHLSGGAGIIVIFTALFAWRGRVPYIRFIFQGTIILSAFFLTIILIRVIGLDEDIEVTQLTEALQGILCFQAPLMLLMLIYTLWYFNRAPSRAFYAGLPLNTFISQHTTIESNIYEGDPS